MASNKNDCFVINCDCQCLPCSLYRAYKEYRKLWFRDNRDNEPCLADCEYYKEKE